MDRRSFVKKSLGASIAFGAFVKHRNIISSEFFLPESHPLDLVAIRGGEPDAMFDQGIAALGGMKCICQKRQ